MTAVIQFLGNRLLEALRNHQRPLLVNGCINTYSRSNKQSLRDNETYTTVVKCGVCSVREELSEQKDNKRKTVDRHKDSLSQETEVKPVMNVV
jgi:hypothetical protein